MEPRERLQKHSLLFIVQQLKTGTILINNQHIGINVVQQLKTIGFLQMFAQTDSGIAALAYFGATTTAPTQCIQGKAATQQPPGISVWQWSLCQS